MFKSSLISELELLKTASRENRLRVADLVLNGTYEINELVQLAFKVEDKLSIKAFWVLEFVVKNDFKLIIPYLNFLSKNAHKVIFGSAVRPLSKIIQIIIHYNDKEQFLKSIQKEKFTEVLFDWLMSNHKVAIKAYSMYSLFLLGKEIDWIHQELKTIVLNNMNNESSAYKSRGKITLEQIKKYNLSKIN